MLHIRPMEPRDVPAAIVLWRQSYRACCSQYPDFLPGSAGVLEPYLQTQLHNGTALVAEQNGIIVGYIAWLLFDFHGERTAFCPIIGHAASPTAEIAASLALYTAASEQWVRDRRYNHLMMIYNDHAPIKDLLYELGFGSYVMDCCVPLADLRINRSDLYPVHMAGVEDVDALLAFAETTNAYYSAAPIFLIREPYTRESIEPLVRNEQLFFAKDGNQPIGVMSFSSDHFYDSETLTTPDSACLDGIGAYISPTYRGQGVGTALLKAVRDRCIALHKTHLHVCYETANPFARAYWPRYFHPTIRSVRRTVNKDASG